MYFKENIFDVAGMNNTGNKKYLYHYGSASGYESYMTINPSENTFAVFISNVNGSKRETLKYYINSLLF